MKGNVITQALAATAFALFMLILILHEARTPPESRLAPPDRLAQVFEKIVFFTEFGPDIKYVKKWSPERPVFLYPEGDARIEFRNDMMDYAGKLSRLTGLTFELTNTLKHDSRVALTRVYFGPRRDLKAVVRKHDGRSERLENFLRHSPICMGSSAANNEGIIRRDFIYVSVDRPRPAYLSCLLEEMTQGLGLPNDADLILPTIFSDKSAPLDLTLNDRILVRTLYDDRLKPGMPRAEAMRVARRVIAELHVAVRAQGPDALIHPRYRARAGTGNASPAR